MTNNPEQLDAEYRAFVRSLHKDTVNAVIEAHKWWLGDCYRIVASGGYDESDKRDSKEVADALEQKWRNMIRPQLDALAQGHPDPDVRLAADVLAHRMQSIILILIRPRTDEKMESDKTSVAIHLVNDGFTRLRKAAYHAPFRVNRPSPTFDGTPVGISEPLPGKMLEQIKELQDAGVVAPASDFLRRGIYEGIEKLSDAFFASHSSEEAR